MSEQDNTAPPSPSPGAGHTPMMASASPGRLASTTTMQIHTRAAFSLIDGRARAEGTHPIPGLRQCGTALRFILAGCREDDPFADMFLVHVEDHFEEQAQLLANLNAAASERLASRDRVTASPSKSDEPSLIRLAFNNPYGYRAAYLLLDFDEYVQKIRTLAHIGYLPRRESGRLLDEAGTLVRSAFHKTLGYRYTGVTPEQYVARSDKAVAAIEKYGEIPLDIFEGKRVAQYAPVKLPVFNRGLEREIRKEKVVPEDADFKVEKEGEHIDEE